MSRIRSSITEQVVCIDTFLYTDELTYGRTYDCDVLLDGYFLISDKGVYKYFSLNRFTTLNGFREHQINNIIK